MIATNAFSPDEPGIFAPILDVLLTHGDYYRHLADLSAYVETQDRGKNPGLVRAEGVGGDHLEGAAGFRLMGIVPLWVVPATAVLNLFCRQAEEEKVLLAPLLGHFDRRAVTRANGQGAVHHELP